MLKIKRPMTLLTGGLILLFIVSCKATETVPINAPTERVQTFHEASKLTITETPNEIISTVYETTEPVLTITPTETIPLVYETKDLKFATIILPEQEDQLLDVYQPVGEGSYPVVVLLHGYNARKEGYIDLSQDIAENGVVVFTINWPTWVIDLAVKDEGKGFREIYDVISCAIIFARVKAPDYSGDPSKIILIGHSYGALTGSWVSLGNDKITTLWNEFEAGSEGPASNVECAVSFTSNNVDAFIGIAGPYHWLNKLYDTVPELWEIVSPYAFLDQDLELPIRLIHGEQDDTVALEVSVDFNNALQNAGYDSKLVLHGGSHRVPNELTISEILNIIEIID